MSLIKKFNELTVSPYISAIIYGQHGVGKTTLSLSAPDPLIFDFDDGINRVNLNHITNSDIVQVNSYQNFIDVINNEDLSKYKSIVIDTGGKMLDSMSDYIIRNSPNKGRSNGMLTLQGFGERKMMFSKLLEKIKKINKHVIFVAHRETITEGEDIRYIPQFGGKNYDSLVREVDLIGYIETNGRERRITFDPTNKNDGKNTCNFPFSIKIPNIINQKNEPNGKNDFIENVVIKAYNDKQIQRKNLSSKYNEILNEINKNVNDIKNAEDANKFIEYAKQMEHLGSSRIAASSALMNKALELGLTLNKEIKKYE